jgi:mercuric ion transport protein
VFAGLGGIGAAFFGALCCLGPLVFVTFGVGAGLAATFEPLRPLFGGLMVVAFLVGFYTSYRPQGSTVAESSTCGIGAACEEPRSRTRERAILWIALLLAIVLWTVPMWSVWLV